MAPDASGSASGTLANWPFSIQRPGNGASGGCPVQAQAYAVFVDERDQVWVSDFGANTLVRFDPMTETFTAHQLPGPASNVRQILGRPGECGALHPLSISSWSYATAGPCTRACGLNSPAIARHAE